MGIAVLQLVAGILCCLLTALPAAAEKRIALVIGNNDYPALEAGEQLQRAVNDANAVGDALAILGFEVVRGENVSRGEMLSTLLATADKLEPGDFAFFFYAGHGVSIDGANYLLPSDIPGATSGGEELIKLSAIAESTVVSTLKGRGVRIAVVVLDACRNNPFSQGGTRAFGDSTRGLARPPALETEGVFGLYSAGFGEQALDGLSETDPDPNSVFTRVLVPALSAPGQSLLDIAYAVNEEVKRLADSVDHEQNPAYYDQARARDVYLIEAEPGGGGTGDAATAGADRADDNSCEGAQLHFEAAREIGRVEALEDHVRHFGDCAFAGLAEMLIEQLRGASAEEVAAIAPPEETPSGAPPTVDPHLVAKALVTALKGDSDFEVAYDIANLRGGDVVVEGISVSRRAAGGDTLRFPETIVATPSILGHDGFLSPRITFGRGGFVGTTKGHIESVVIADFATIPQLTAGAAAASPGFTFSTMEAAGLYLQHPTRPETVTVRRLSVEGGDFVGNRPQNLRGRIEGLSLPQIAFIESGIGIDPAALGYNNMVVDLVWDGSINFGNRSLTLRDLALAVEEGGVLSLTASLQNVPDLATLFGPGVEEAIKNIRLEKATLRYDDNSLAGRFFDQIGREAKQSRPEMVAEMEVGLPRNLALDPGFELQIVQMLRAFVLDPRSLSFSIEPDTPLSVYDVQRIVEAAPETLHQRLGVTMTTNAE